MEQLVKAIQAAGKDDESISVVVLRGGDDRRVKIRPTERKQVDFEFGNIEMDDAAKERLKKAMEQMKDKGFNQFKLEKFGPGVIDRSSRDKGPASDLKREIERLRKEIEELKRSLKDNDDD